MQRMSSHNPVRSLRFAGVFPCVVLLISIACSHAMSGGNRGDVGAGMKAPPGNDPATRDYFKKHVDFPWFKEVDGQFKEVRIKVKPEKSVHNRSWAEALTLNIANGAIVARIENVDKKNVPELGLTPTDKYSYMWVGPLRAGVRGVSFYTFDKDGNALKKGDLEYHSVTVCPDFNGDRPRAQFNPAHNLDDCQVVQGLGSSVAQSARVAQLASYSLTRRPALLAGGIWISCSGGCCEVGGSEFH